MISDAVDSLPLSSQLSLGQSRYAPKQPSILGIHRPFADVFTTSPQPANLKMSDDDRRARDASFQRMSFKAADWSPLPKLPKIAGQDQSTEVSNLPALDSIAGEKSFLTIGHPNTSKENVAPEAPRPSTSPTAQFIPPHLRAEGGRGSADIATKGDKSPKQESLAEANHVDVASIQHQPRTMIESGATRCVRVVGGEEDWTLQALYKKAERKGRKVEDIEDGKDFTGVSTLTR